MAEHCISQRIEIYRESSDKTNCDGEARDCEWDIDSFTWNVFTLNYYDVGVLELGHETNYTNGCIKQEVYNVRSSDYLLHASILRFDQLTVNRHHLELTSVRVENH